MELRNGALVGGSSGVLPPAARPAFEEAVSRVFQRWTGLAIAVENLCGGSSSHKKADELIDETLTWFYGQKEHYADVLEGYLTEFMDTEFNMLLEDDSPRQVARELVHLHDEMLQGGHMALQRLLQAPLPPTAAGQRIQAEGEDSGSSSSTADSDDDGDDGGESGEGPVDMDTDEAPRAVAVQPPRTPIIDDDGFQLVQSRRRGNPTRG